jgi:uncharacterized repeat protein (TIGR03843 family)
VTSDGRAELTSGEIEVIGRMPWSSNGTFLVEVVPGDADEPVRAVYKPERGERPLWDFPSGLWRREIAAWVIDDALGWDTVPPTVRRDDAPLGVGSLQRFVDADFEQHYFTLLEDEANHPQLQRMCAFDLIVNNTDRKGGHCLVDGEGHIWGIDNGLSFATEFKVRTVIWDFAGDPVPDELREDVAALLDRGLPPELDELLDPLERDAVRTRARALVQASCFPTDPTGRRFPWPLV